MQTPKIRELGEAIKSLFSRPATSAFPAKPHVPFEGFRGKPQFSESSCVGCGACAQVCPGKAIELEDVEQGDKVIRTLTVRYDNCIFCGTCEANCITGDGIVLTPEYILATTDRNQARSSIEHELQRCELCSATMTSAKHLLWIYTKLGPLAWGNPTLLLTAQREMIPVDPGMAGEELRRPDIFKVLCPRCRKKVSLKDLYG